MKAIFYYSLCDVIHGLTLSSRRAFKGDRGSRLRSGPRPVRTIWSLRRTSSSRRGHRYLFHLRTDALLGSSIPLWALIRSQKQRKKMEISRTEEFLLLSPGIMVSNAKLEQISSGKRVIFFSLFKECTFSLLRNRSTPLRSAIFRDTNVTFPMLTVIADQMVCFSLHGTFVNNEWISLCSFSNLPDCFSPVPKLSLSSPLTQYFKSLFPGETYISR